MPTAHKPVTITPKEGGKLATDVSANEVGMANYRIKRDWRRYVDRELRREGSVFLPIAIPDVILAGGDESGDYVWNPSLNSYFNGSVSISQSKPGFWVLLDEIQRYQCANASFPVGPWTRVSDGSTTSIVGAYSSTFNGPVTLIHKSKSPNQAISIIVGTPTTLYRYYSAPDYYALGDSNGPYFASDYVDNPTAAGWKIIGDGFTASANRWEVFDLGPDMVFNNGVDLPVVYSLSEFDVTPLYELRENEIISLGTIWQYNSVSMGADVSQVKGTAAALAAVMQPIKQAGTASQVGSARSGLTAGTIASGDTVLRTGTNYVSAAAAIQPSGTYSQTSGFDLTGLGFFQPGVMYSMNPISTTGKLVNGTETITFTPFVTFEVMFRYQGAALTVYGNTVGPSSFGAIHGGPDYTPMVCNTPDQGSFVFDNTMVGKTLRFDNGWTSVISAVNSPTEVVLSTPAPFLMQLPFSVVGSTSNQVVATNPVFASNMVGRSIFWDNGPSRKIVGYVNATTVQVDTDQSISAGTFSIENPLEFGTVTDTTLIDRRGYRVTWGALRLARRYAATVNCSINAGSNVLTFAYPIRSFSVGQKIVITGAGVSGANLTATIQYVETGGLKAVLDMTASTTVLATDTLDSFGNLLAAAGQVSAWDMIGSIVGFDDLEEDGSRIIRGLELNGGLVLYRESGYQLGSYTGDPTSPFNFPEMVTTPNTLYYKYTLIKVTWKGYDIHMFAGRNTFFRFDGISRAPIETLTSASYTWQQGGAGGDINLCRRTFYQQAAAIQTVTFNGVTYQSSNFIFSCDNEMTREIFVCFPSTSQDQCLCFDYENGTVSTSSAAYTAGETVFNPGSTIGEKWFIMGASNGMVLQYGKADVLQPGWFVLNYPDGTQYAAIFSRNGAPYESRLKSGMGGFNQNLNEKHVDAYLLELSSFSPDTPVTVNIYGATNPNVPAPDPEKRGETLLGTAILTAANNLFPVHFQQYYFADEIVVNGINNPCELVARTYNLAVVRTVGVTKASGG